MGDFHITSKDIDSCKGGGTSCGSYPKEIYKSDLQSPLEFHKEEDKATPLVSEPESLVEE